MHADRRFRPPTWLLVIGLLVVGCGGNGTGESDPTVTAISAPVTQPSAATVTATTEPEATATATSQPVATTATQTSAATATSTAEAEATASVVSPIEPTAAVQSFRIELGAEEAFEPAGAELLEYLPDGHISYITTDEEVLLWLTAATDSYLFTGPDLEQLELYTVDDRPAPVLGPDGEGFDENYAGFGAVIPRPEQDDLIGLYHAEQCTSENFTATIGLARSTDEGYTWEKLGAVITGQALAPLCSVTTGAGELSATVTADGYVYLYYVDWSSGVEDGPADQVYLARAPLAQAHEIGAWKKYAAGAFDAPGIGGQAEPVIPVPEPVDANAYAALPSVTWNSFLGRYIAVFETDIGFYYTTSPDGIVWEAATQLLEFSQPQGQRKLGDLWFSYPTLLSPAEASHLTTSQSGHLYYSRGTWDDQPHRPVRRPFTLVVTP